MIDRDFRDVGVVVIGRNEGDRLRVCLGSVASKLGRVVYVDSGSTDGSVDLARSLGVEVVELDTSTRFTAARARNEGLARLLEVVPGARFVQFVDGDCEFVPGWIEAAVSTLEAAPEAAVVCGRVRERHPEASIYNRLAEMEWDRPAGEVDACGGIAMMRVDAFEEVGGFNASVAAGEEPELCFRLRRAGWKVLRLADEMVRHDLAMTKFSQWWRRSVRFGRGALEVARLCKGAESPYARQIRSMRRWTFGPLLTLVIAAPTAYRLAGPPASAIVCVLVVLAMAAQGLRIAWKARVPLGSTRAALSFGALSMIGKWGELLGQFQQWRRPPRPSPRAVLSTAPTTAVGPT